MAAHPSSTELQKRFFERFARRTLLVHEGFPAGFFAELIKQPGGGGHFRVDGRLPASTPPSPMDWVVHQHVLPHGLPLPVLIRVDDDALYLRHLQHDGVVGHPSEILWMLDSIRERYHLCLRATPTGFTPEPGMAVSDNRIDYDFYNDA